MARQRKRRNDETCRSDFKKSDDPRERSSAGESVNADAPLITRNKNCRPVLGSKNDAGWFKDPAGIVSDAARIPTYFPQGAPLFKERENETVLTSMPTTLVCGWIPFPGVSTNATSPMSIAAQVIYQQITKVVNKNTEGYQYADPFIAYVCFLSMMAFADEMRRDMQIVNTYSTVNLAFPNAMLNSLGYNDKAIKDLKDNIANYRQSFNMLMYDMSAIYMPIETNIGTKYRWLAQNVWEDHDNHKAQIYMYAMEGFYLFDETTSNQGSKAAFVPFLHEFRVRDDKLFYTKLNHLRNMVSQLRSSDSYKRMMADMQRAFPDATTYTFPLMDEKDYITPSINSVMLNQFQNIRTLPALNWTTTVTQEGPNKGRYTNAVALDITQDVTNNTIVAKPRLSSVYDDTVPAYGRALKAINDYEAAHGVEINFTSPTPNEDEVIDNLHGIAIWSDDPENNSAVILEHSSCVLYTGFLMTRTLQDATTKSLSYDQNTFGSYLDVTRADSLDTVFQLASFDWHPLIYFLSDGDMGENNYVSRYGEKDCVVRVRHFSISRLFDAEQFGLWKVPNNIVTGTIK